jgi:hypothetical protein
MGFLNGILNGINGMLGIFDTPDYGQAQSLQKQALDNFQKYNTEAEGFRNEAAGGYRNFSKQGNQQYANAMNYFSRLLPQYQNYTGLNIGAYGNDAASKLNYVAGTGGGYDPAKGATYAPSPGTENRTPMAGMNRNTAPAAGTGATVPAGRTTDPYQLTPAQQVQLNGQVDRIARQKQTAIDGLKAQFAANGISDPRVMQSQIQQYEEMYDGMAEQSKAGFAEQARAAGADAVKYLIDFANQQQGQGLNQQQFGVQGINNLQNDAMSAASNPTLQNLSGASAQLAGAEADAGNMFMNSLLSAAGQFAGGAFNPTKPTTPAPARTGEVFGPPVTYGQIPQTDLYRLLYEMGV